MKQHNLDRQYMRRALRLAAKGRGYTTPNPMVGAVVVSAGRIVGQGYHHRAGEPHAEVLALQQAGSRSRKGTLYVTLEPCTHTTKRTPPCAPLLIEAGLRRVVIAMTDPNPSVSGRGVRALERTGVKVDVGCSREEAEVLNEAYCHWMKTGRPFVVLKAGMTLDGKIATSAGESRWITSDAARSHVHRVRSRVDAVMVGIGTVLHDDPQLTVRVRHRQVKLAARQPLRVVVDTRLRLPLQAQVIASRSRAQTLVATTAAAPRSKIDRLRARGVEVMILPTRKGQVSLSALLARLGRRQITSLLVEGGGRLNASMLRTGLVNRVMLYVAPRLLGGDDARGVIGGPSPRRLADSLSIENVEWRPIGPDLLVTGIVGNT
ncbi:MAG: bifunctional diaminohydroxyphosphoribosylaminopyrimidine deaminase/5-amino-6-(5-phosphoribosylamino)uracil reductase RibD [Nitrospiraceae bacterium]